MDGVLLDSEPFWRKSEIRVFATVGLELTEAMCMQTMGMRMDQVVDFWYDYQPWEGKSRQQIEGEVLDAMVEFIRTQAVPMAGVREALEFFKARGLPLAVASSSAMRLIDAVMDRFGIRDYFEVLCSAEHEPYGKPHPGVYLTTAQRLGVAPEQCLAIEDSFNGLIAAKAARMKTIVLPEEDSYPQTRFDIADVKLRSLLELDEAVWARLK
jgi:sugar-phosphatase